LEQPVVASSRLKFRDLDRLVKDRAVRQDHAEEILAGLRSATPDGTGSEAPEPDLQTDDFGYSV
jgi:hypothetical protein